MGRRVKQESFSDIKVWHEGFKPSLKSQSEDQHANNLMFEFWTFVPYIFLNSESCVGQKSLPKDKSFSLT